MGWVLKGLLTHLYAYLTKEHKGEIEAAVFTIQAFMGE
jgi:hypothetical protein